MNSILRTRLLPTVAALLSMFVFALTGTALPATILRVSEELSISAAKLAGFISLQFAAFFVSASLAGAISQRLGKRVVFVCSGFLLVTGAAVWATAHSIAQIALATALWGFAGGIIESMSSALLCELYPRKRSVSLNVSQAVFTIGAVGGPWVAGMILPRGLSWRYLFAGVGMLSGFLLLVFIASAMPDGSSGKRGVSVKARKAGGLWSFLAPCIALFIYVLVEASVAVYANMYMREVCEAPENWAIYSLSFFWGCMLLGRGVCALLPERYSNELLVAFLFFLSAVGALLLGLRTPWQLSLAVFGFLGFAFAGTWPIIVALASRRAGENHDSAVGLTVAAGSLGCVAAPPLMNLLFGLLPGRFAFALLSLPMIAGAALINYKKPLGSPEEPSGN